MTPTDLLGFVRMHLDGGVAPDGTRVLSAESVRAMQTREVDLPRLAGMGDAWGLGWELFDTPQGTVIAHDGGTIGQAAFLRVVPERGRRRSRCSPTAATSSASSTTWSPRCSPGSPDVELPALPTPPADPRAGGRQPLPGSLRRHHLRHHRQPGRRRPGLARPQPKDIHAEIGEKPIRFELVHFADDSLITVEAYHGIHVVFAFIGSVTSARASTRRSTSTTAGSSRAST